VAISGTHSTNGYFVPAKLFRGVGSPEDK